MPLLTSGATALVAAGVCLGFSSILVEASEGEPITVAALRAGLAALTALPLAALEMRKRGRPPRRVVLYAAAAGVALGLDFSCWNIAILEAGAGVATVLVNVQVVLMPLLLLALDRIRPDRLTWVLAPTMLIGVGLAGGLASPGGGTAPSALGIVCGVAAGAGYTGYLYLLRRGSGEHNRWPLTTLVTACASAATAATLVGAGSGSLRPPATARAWFLIVVLALVGQLIAFGLINRGVVLLPTRVSGVLLLLPSVFALVLAAVLLDQVPSPTQVLGCLLIILGAACAARGTRRSGCAPFNGLVGPVGLVGPPGCCRGPAHAQMRDCSSAAHPRLTNRS